MSESAVPALGAAILAYYERRPEEHRLQHGLSQLEALRTRRLIERFAPPPSAVVLDVGTFSIGGARPPTEVMVQFIDAHRAAYGVESIRC